MRHHVVSRHVSKAHRLRHRPQPSAPAQRAFYVVRALTGGHQDQLGGPRRSRTNQLGAGNPGPKGVRERAGGRPCGAYGSRDPPRSAGAPTGDEPVGGSEWAKVSAKASAQSCAASSGTPSTMARQPPLGSGSTATRAEPSSCRPAARSPASTASARAASVSAGLRHRLRAASASPTAAAVAPATTGHRSGQDTAGTTRADPPKIKAIDPATRQRQAAGRVRTRRRRCVLMCTAALLTPAGSMACQVAHVAVSSATAAALSALIRRSSSPPGGSGRPARGWSFAGPVVTAPAASGPHQ
jgi:hypothetical protein